MPFIMAILRLSELGKKELFFQADEHGREIYEYLLEDVMVAGEDELYPNILFYSSKNGMLYNPSEERTMSLSNSMTVQQPCALVSKHSSVQECPVFFFIYNTDNYFHFLYDSLPYLLSFLHLKKQIPNLKLLMSFPNSNKVELHRFVLEFLELMGISYQCDVEMVNKHTLYKTVYISSSMTHGIDSNLPPRKEIYGIYKQLSEMVDEDKSLPRKLYISRRSWLHNDFSNIGTNYTTRRKLINEDALVLSLKNLGFSEVFTETMTTIEKIRLFKSADTIVGAIGGGISNVLFSKPSTKLLALVSPTFLEVNARFKHTLSKVATTYMFDSWHYSNDKYKKYMRVQLPNNILGEIIDISSDKLTVAYSVNTVAGWNMSEKYNSIVVDKSQVQLLDSGLNSEWVIDVEKVLGFLHD